VICERCGYDHNGYRWCYEWEYLVTIELAGLCRCSLATTWASDTNQPETCGNCGRWKQTPDQWRDLAPFVRLFENVNNGAERRVTREALAHYRLHLKSQITERYCAAEIELSVVSGAMLALEKLEQ
jgi:hypothetical protein